MHPAVARLGSAVLRPSVCRTHLQLLRSNGSGPGSGPSVSPEEVSAALSSALFRKETPEEVLREEEGWGLEYAPGDDSSWGPPYFRAEANIMWDNSSECVLSSGQWWLGDYTGRIERKN